MFYTLKTILIKCNALLLIGIWRGRKIALKFPYCYYFLFEFKISILAKAQVSEVPQQLEAAITTNAR
jgi:hypothetical protein